MPRYDYECDSCHHRFELKQSFDSEPIATCPNCENRARRKFHAVPIVFKGSGWYVNDYGRRNSNTSAPADATEPSSSRVESKSSADSRESSSSEGKASSPSAKAESAPAKAKGD